MESFKIEATKFTPLVVIDYKNNSFLMQGQSYPENAAKFFKLILTKFYEFVNKTQKNKTITVNLRLIYLNTSSSKAVLILLDNLKSAVEGGKSVVINWYYHEENQLAYEIGEELSEYVNIPFNFIVETDSY